MPKLADFAEKSGNTQQALTWLRDAYDKASGEATRFQWGTYYLAGLLELTPEEGESIKNTFIQLTQELANPQDLYNGRNKKRIETIEEKIRVWYEATGNNAIYEDIKATMAKLCVQFSTEHEELVSCNNFLSS